MKAPRTVLTMSLLAFCAAVALGALIEGFGTPSAAMAQGRGGKKVKGVELPVILEFRDDASDRILSDGSPYVADTVGVNARISSDGRLVFGLEAPRYLVLDFSVEAVPPECAPKCRKNFIVASTIDYEPGPACMVWVVDEFGNDLPGGFLGMSVNDSMRGKMKLGWSGAPGSTRFAVRFQEDGSVDDSVASAILEKTTYLEITRVAQDRWIIEAREPPFLGLVNAGDRGLLFSRGKKRDGGTLDEGTYHMRFSMTVTTVPSDGEGGGAALSGTLLLRGDCNDDGNVDLSDAVCTLNWLFLGGSAPGCVAATNTNGDGAADISDATYLLNHLFLGGPAPVEPFPDCAPGTLQADEELGCEMPPKSCE